MRNSYAKWDNVIHRILGDSRYFISPKGNVYKRRNENIWDILGQTTDQGYRRYKPRINGKQANILLHRVVYAKYNGILDDSMVVNHINGVRHDNRPDNLEQITMLENSGVAKRKIKKG